MKIIRKKSLGYVALGILLLANMVLGSCSKWLDVEPQEVLVEEQMYRNIYDADAAVIGIYGKFLALAEQHILWNELRGDLLTVTDRANPHLQEINANDVAAMSPDNPYLNPRKFYEVILNCNDVIANFVTMRADNKLAPDEFDRRYSDVLAIRTWVYLQLGIHFGRVPYVTDPLPDTESVLDASRYPLMDFDQLLSVLISDMESAPYKVVYPDTESLMFMVDGYEMDRFYINKQALLGDLYLWDNNYQKAAENYKLVMTSYDNMGNDGYRYDRFKIKWAEVSTNNDLAIGYLRFREQDIRTLVNSKTQGWRSMFSRTQDVLWNTEWVWALPFSSSFQPENPFPALFAANGGEHLLKPSLESFALWNNQTQRNGVPYDARRDLSVSMIGDEGIVTKYTDEFSDIETLLPIDQFARSGKWHLYRAAKLHLRFAEAANRDGHHKLAVGLLNNGVGRIYDDPDQTDKTDLQQTHLPFPYDFQARMGTNPFFRDTWHRNDGVRGRAYVTFREIDPIDSLTQVENYLIEEAALELAFEGNRWEDLLRIARRRNDPSFLADKIYQKLYKEGHPQAAAIRGKLMQRENWYFPLQWSAE